MQPLADQIGNLVLDQLGVTVVSKASSEALDDAATSDYFPEKKPTRVRGHIAPIEGGHDAASSICLKIELCRITVCHGQLVSFRCVATKKVPAKRRKISWPTLYPVRNAG